MSAKNCWVASTVLDLFFKKYIIITPDLNLNGLDLNGLDLMGL